MLTMRMVLLCFIYGSCVFFYRVSGSFRSSIQINSILYLHNSIRTNATPTATNMAKLVWDRNMANEAQVLTDGCDYQKSTSVNHGQLMYHTPTTFTEENTLDFPVVVQSWFDAGTSSESYRQMIWAEVRTFGCGKSQCKPLITPTGNLDPAYFMACYYNLKPTPTGDPYEEGPSCSNCPLDISACEAKLCVEPPPTTEGPSTPPSSVPPVPVQNVDNAAVEFCAGPSVLFFIYLSTLNALYV